MTVYGFLAVWAMSASALLIAGAWLFRHELAQAQKKQVDVDVQDANVVRLKFGVNE